MARQGDQYVTQARLRRSQDVVFETVGKWLGQQLAQSLEAYTESKVAPLLRMIEELEARELKFIGPWKLGTVARAGMACSWDGSLWIALRDTDHRPGIPNSGWQLAVKRESRRHARQER